MTEHKANSAFIAQTIGCRGGLQVTIADVGATIASVVVPLPHGSMNAVLSYDELQSYGTDPYYLGSTVGPFANRIGGAAFELDGNNYELVSNDGERGNCLHGGKDGFHQLRFRMDHDASQQKLVCTTTAHDGEGGFPGNRHVEVIYQLLDEWSLVISYTVTTDKDTIINLANHAYFNLGGRIDDHLIRVIADSITPVSDGLVPTGQLQEVAGSDYDLRELQPLGARQFDRNFVLDGTDDQSKLAAELYSNSTGLQLSVLTTQPALQVYTGDYLDQPFKPRQGICLEAQGFPDAPNQSSFPSTRLMAGGTYRQETIYRFGYDPDKRT